MINCDDLGFSPQIFQTKPVAADAHFVESKARVLLTLVGFYSF